MRAVADHLGEDPDAENLAERIGWGKPLEEKWSQFEKLLNGGWVMKQSNRGDVFISIGEVKPHKQKSKGTVYDFGRIQVLVDPEWVGYTAMIVLSKNKTPKFKTYTTEEIGIEKLSHIDPSDVADIVIEAKNGKGENPEKSRESRPDWELDEFS